jgi:hypothetical protein
MVQPLPFRGFRLDEIEEGRPVEGLLKMSTDREDDNDIGCILELDMFAPTEIHDLLKEFPPAPENIDPKVEWFSDFQRDLGQKAGASRRTVPTVLLASWFLISLRERTTSSTTGI